MSPDESKSPPDQIPQVYYGRKPSRRDGSGQDVTGSSIDWLRLKIGQSGWIDKLGAWTERAEMLGERERGWPVITVSFILFVCWRVQNYAEIEHVVHMYENNSWSACFTRYQNGKVTFSERDFL